MTETAELESEVRTLLEQGDLDAAIEFLNNRHPAEVGGVIDELDGETAYALFDQLDRRTQARILPYMQPSHQLSMVQHLGRHAQARLLTDMNADERADLYQELPEDVQEALMPALAKAEREDLLRLTSYPEGTVGSVMTSEYATVPAHISARQAIERLRLQALNKETIYVAYVLDTERHLLGIVTLSGLVVASPGESVEDLMQTEVVNVHTDAPSAEAARLIADYDLLAVPVVDDEDRMVGIVTHDDAMDVQEAEATEDIHKGASVGDLPGSLKETALTTLYQKRIMWLVLLVFANVFSGASISLYEDTIQAHVGLVFFLPLLIASAGNAGSQSATLMVRAIATGDVISGDWFRMLLREIGLGLMLGLTMAAAVAAIGLYRGGAELAHVVSLTMVIVVLSGSLIGMSLPFVLNKLNMDPATASAPVVSFIADVAGILVYFGLASALLSIPAQ
ncbi:magnesium transporter [Halospina sp. K52047b]|uniref:magnesium transporter n=1 Tax=Halospina sp. K52047b TaxID=2614160 RepID=UPI001249D957|nr:magnesium transporter [Halospina sp. K52047b]KAA8980335.1 magnesium transporter [Halospina sp. K52047b]